MGPLGSLATEIQPPPEDAPPPIRRRCDSDYFLPEPFLPEPDFLSSLSSLLLAIVVLHTALLRPILNRLFGRQVPRGERGGWKALIRISHRSLGRSAAIAVELNQAAAKTKARRPSAAAAYSRPVCPDQLWSWCPSAATNIDALPT